MPVNPSDIIEMNRRLEKESREEKDKGGGIVRPAKPGGGGKYVPVLSGTAPIVDSEAGTAGTSTTDALAADTKPGNRLVGTPGLVVDDTATLYPSLEYVEKTDHTKRGQRVRIGTTYVAGGVGEVADLEVKAPTAGPDSKSGVVLRLGANLKRDANGIALDGHKTTHEDGGGDEISIAGLAGEAAAEQKPKIDGLTAETTVADADTFPFYDATASANRKVTAANLKTYCGAGGGGVDVDGAVLGSSQNTGAATVFESTLGADGDYLVWFYAKITGASGACRVLLKYTVDMDTYTVGQAHGYVSDTTEGSTLFGMTRLTSWDNDVTLNMYCEMASGTGTVNAAWTGMYWMKY